MKLQNLTLFSELSIVLNSHKVASWQIMDFWSQMKLLKIDDNKANYQSVCRLITRLVKDRYLSIDNTKNRFSYTTYSETSRMQIFRNEFHPNVDLSLIDLKTKMHEFEQSCRLIIGEVNALDELKEIFPSLQFKIEQLKFLKTNEIQNYEQKIRAINSLIDYFVSEFSNKLK